MGPGGAEPPGGGAEPWASSLQGLESCLKGPDNYNSQVLIEATVIALTKLQPLLSKVPEGGTATQTLQLSCVKVPVCC